MVQCTGRRPDAAARTPQRDEVEIAGALSAEAPGHLRLKTRAFSFSKFFDCEQKQQFLLISKPENFFRMRLSKGVGVRPLTQTCSALIEKP